MNRLFHSEISLPGVVTGIAVALSFNTLLMSFMAASGSWTVQPSQMLFLGKNFWVMSAAVWNFSVICGVTAGALVTGRATRRSFVLTALAVWAVSYMVFGGMMPTMAEINSGQFGRLPPEFLWIGFAGDLMSLVLALTAGALSVGFFAKRPARTPFPERFTVDFPLPTT